MKLCVAKYESTTASILWSIQYCTFLGLWQSIQFICCVCSIACDIKLPWFGEGEGGNDALTDINPKVNLNTKKYLQCYIYWILLNILIVNPIAIQVITFIHTCKRTQTHSQYAVTHEARRGGGRTRHHHVKRENVCLWGRMSTTTKSTLASQSESFSIWEWNSWRAKCDIRMQAEK